MSLHKITDPLTIFLVGVTGDLSKRKILKAVYKLFEQGLLPQPFTLIGNARKVMSRSEFQVFVRDIVGPKEATAWESFQQCLYYVSGDATKRESFMAIQKLHSQLVGDHHCGNHMWYIATLPQLYVDIVERMKEAGLHQSECGWTKILIEKPFGTDLPSAKKLNQELRSIFFEEQIYRIDHFLGKETVQNLLAFRFANGLFEELWSREYIDHIQVTFAETLGVAGREQFYDATGATRDVVQNHLLHMIAVTMMEEPASLEAKDIRQARSALLSSLTLAKSTDGRPNVVFGQFSAGKIDGEDTLSYRDHDAIPSDSRTETEVALKLEANTSRWQGVPIYVRTGKYLAQDVLEISIQFKDPKNAMFRHVKYGPDPNVLTFRFQPNEGIVLRLYVKKPGHGVELDMVPMQFCYRNTYQMGLIEAYERLIHDASVGDPTLFPSAEGIESTWQITDEILAAHAHEPDMYKAGGWGPASFEKLIEQDGRKWIEPSVDICQI